MRITWMLFDAVSGNTLDATDDLDLAQIWELRAEADPTLVVIPFEVEENGVYFNMKEDTMADKKKKEQKVVEMEPGDDVEDAQPSIEREDAATGRTGGSGTGGPNSAPAGSGGESGSPV